MSDAKVASCAFIQKLQAGVFYPVLRVVRLKRNPTMDALLRVAALLLLGLLCSSLRPTFSHRVHPPPHDQVARVARFVAHQCDWASVATISTHQPVVGQPFSNVFSVSDGPLGSGSGVPYMYLTRMEISVQDLQVKPGYFFLGSFSFFREVFIVKFTSFMHRDVGLLCSLKSVHSPKYEISN